MYLSPCKRVLTQLPMETRTFYTLGNYEAAISSVSSAVQPDEFELISLVWKSILRVEGDVSKCAQFWGQCACPSELLKKSLMIWSKVFKGVGSSICTGQTTPTANTPTSTSADLMAAQEIAIKAHESAEIDPLERDQVILTCAETALLLNSTEAAFNLLKLVKASNLDCQVMFIEILLRLGQVDLARGRLEKMKNIPEWKDDVRFLLTEAQIGLNIDTSDNDYSCVFTPKDSLYSYQELIQIHGQTPRLLLFSAAAYILLGKFQEAQNSLLQISEKYQSDPIVKANIVVLSALLNSSTFDSLLK